MSINDLDDYDDERLGYPYDDEDFYTDREFYNDAYDRKREAEAEEQLIDTMREETHEHEEPTDEPS
jgi:hypothetical protein